MSEIESIETVVIGAGHAGLAVSRFLAGAGSDHVVLDRGDVGESWRTERWDSLHLLTPNWMTRLPGWMYAGPDQDAYMSVSKFVRYLEGYADSFDAPVVTGTTVLEVTQTSSSPDRRYRIVTDRGSWQARNVVIATGPHGTPNLPAGLRPGSSGPVEVLTSNQYRNPAQLPTGGVLVVGASSSGVQIADELNRAGREVSLAVGRHNRLPRRYRGMDIFWWLENTGRLARTIDQMRDPVAARGEPSLQLIGRNEPEQGALDLDLGTLQDRGVRLLGRLRDISGATARFRPDLRDSVEAADANMSRILDSVDEYVDQAGLRAEVWPGKRPRPVAVPAATERLDLRAERIGTIVLAAGYRPHHPWLRLPITGPDGYIRQYRGVTPAPGVYVVGQRFQHRRDSSFIDGARHNAAAVVEHLIGTRTRSAAVAGEEASS